MEYRRLGNSGLKVSEISLGGNVFGKWADESMSIAVINHALEANSVKISHGLSSPGRPAK